MACNAQAVGVCSAAEGFNTSANGIASHAEGYLTRSNGPASHAEGGGSVANGSYSHAEGRDTLTIGEQSHAEGLLTVAEGLNSHAEGELTRAVGLDSHAEGLSTLASGQASHAEGEDNTASGRAAHVEGNLNAAIGAFSHSEGQRTVASGDLSHAEGSQTTASGQSSHAEGALTTASGFASHAQGVSTLANSAFSHAEGQSTSTNNLEGAHIMGQFGAANELSYSWYLANGINAAAPGLAAKILSNGDVKIDGTVSSPAADYAEMFETTDGQSIEPGYFVSLEGDKVRVAHSSDRYVIGVVSGKPAFLSDSGEMRWHGKYLTDEWGRVDRQPVLNPEWDPDRIYVPRMRRPEWIAVGLLGKRLVRDDGSCQPGTLCAPNDNGIAMTAEAGYYVLRRTGPRQILILFGKSF